jgi:pimeloyl-ACP methyl ester carboxylesterase
MRARQPDRTGYTTREGVRLYWEVFGDGEPAVFLLPTWSIVHSRHWKFQVAHLARHCSVLVMDGRGNGRSDRPLDPAAYTPEELAADALAVMDATGTRSPALVGFSQGARTALLLAAEHPERVSAVVFMAPALALGSWQQIQAAIGALFDEEFEEHDGWQRYNARYWRTNYRDFVEFFFEHCLPEPHSTKQIEDAVGWALETTPEVLTATVHAGALDPERVSELVARVRCPVLVINGDEDEIVAHDAGAELAERTGGTLLTMEGSGHMAHTRDPVAVNLALQEFLVPAPPPPVHRRALPRPRRALYVSSPIGLGHVRRDLAIVQQLRELVPRLEVDWLAQDPVTRVLETSGERIHPASRHLASESEHIEGESSSHRLHVFGSWRRMDEIFVNNFMVFLEAARDGDYDLWLGDEAWEVDYYLHENPELKRAAYVWLTDIVAWLPMPDLGAGDAFLTADYNAEMIEQIARFPRIRDRAIFIGRPEDVVPGTFGPNLPEVRAWTEEHYRFTGGYILGLEQGAAGDRAALRAELGYGPDDVVCIVSVGGSAVGVDLLRRLMEAYPAARRVTPRLRMIAVAGPRVDPGGLPHVEGVEVHGFVPDLNRRLAACVVALSQGGLSTTMELTAARTPFVYFPLRDHCEQSFHVRHRLDRYRAGRCMDYDDATPDNVAEAISSLVTSPVDFAAVETGTARRAAEMIAELL